MNAASLFQELATAGVALSLRGDALHYAGPSRVLTAATTERIAQAKPELIALLWRQACNDILAILAQWLRNRWPDGNGPIAEESASAEMMDAYIDNDPDHMLTATYRYGRALSYTGFNEPLPSDCLADGFVVHLGRLARPSYSSPSLASSSFA